MVIKKNTEHKKRSEIEPAKLNMNKKPKDPSVLQRKPLVAFFRWVHEIASEKGGEHTHSVEIEPQRVSTLGFGT